MEYICQICIKHYSSYQSLWIHTKKYHKLPRAHSSTSGIHSVYIKPNIPSTSGIHSVYIKPDSDEDIKNNMCKFCKKELSNRQSRWRHQTC